MAKEQIKAENNSQIALSLSRNDSLHIHEISRPIPVQRFSIKRSHNSDQVSKVHSRNVCNESDRANLNISNSRSFPPSTLEATESENDGETPEWNHSVSVSPVSNDFKCTRNICHTNSNRSSKNVLHQSVPSLTKSSKTSFNLSKSSLRSLLFSSLFSSSSFFHHSLFQTFLIVFFSSELSVPPPLRERPPKALAKSNDVHSCAWTRGRRFGLTVFMLVLHLLVQTTPTCAQVV
ncbi:hypothetical protein SK128_015975, partial [Halocaridina rubra]